MYTLAIESSLYSAWWALCCTQCYWVNLGNCTRGSRVPALLYRRVLLYSRSGGTQTLSYVYSMYMLFSTLDKSTAYSVYTVYTCTRYYLTLQYILCMYTVHCFYTHRYSAVYIQLYSALCTQLLYSILYCICSAVCLLLYSVFCLHSA